MQPAGHSPSSRTPRFDRPLDPERAARRVAEVTARAGILEPRAKGGGTLTNEPILVFLGPRRPTLHIFDQYGNQIGTANKSRTEYQLCDSDVRCVVNETKLRGWEYEFVVSDPDGAIIGTINHDRMSRDGRTVATIDDRPRREVLAERAAPSNLMARAHYLLDHLCCCRYTIEDEPGHAVARITYVQPFFVRDHMSFVLESDPLTPEPLRTMLLAMFTVVDRFRPRHDGH
jgi:hypothetical protein